MFRSGRIYQNIWVINLSPWYLITEILWFICLAFPTYDEKERCELCDNLGMGRSNFISIAMPTTWNILFLVFLLVMQCRIVGKKLSSHPIVLPFLLTPFTINLLCIIHDGKCMHEKFALTHMHSREEAKRNWQKSFLNFNWISCCLFHVSTSLFGSVSSLNIVVE